LLIRLEVTQKSKVTGRKITELRETAHTLRMQSELSENLGDEAEASRLHDEAQQKETEVMKLLKH